MGIAGTDRGGARGASAFATGTLTAPTQANTTNGDTLVLGGKTFTAWVSGGAPSAPYVDIRTLTTAQDVALALAASVNATTDCTVTLGTPTSGTATWTAKTAGQDGNVLPTGVWLTRTGGAATIACDGVDSVGTRSWPRKILSFTVSVANQTIVLPFASSAYRKLRLVVKLVGTGSGGNTLLAIRPDNADTGKGYYTTLYGGPTISGPNAYSATGLWYDQNVGAFSEVVVELTKVGAKWIGTSVYMDAAGNGYSAQWWMSAWATALNVFGSSRAISVGSVLDVYAEDE